MSVSSGLESGQLQPHEGHWAWACCDGGPAAQSCWAVTLRSVTSFPGLRSHGSQEAAIHLSIKL